MPTRKLRTDTGDSGEFERLLLAYEKFIELLRAMSLQQRQNEN